MDNKEKIAPSPTKQDQKGDKRTSEDRKGLARTEKDQ